MCVFYILHIAQNDTAMNIQNGSSCQDCVA